MTVERKRIKALIVKTSLDGHWRGPMVVTKALRDAGMEVIYGGRLKSDEIVQTAIQEDVDVIGLNIGGRYGQIADMIKGLRAKEAQNILIVAGGTVPADDVPQLKQMGVSEVFPPGSSLDDIVKYIQKHVNKS